MKFFKDIIYDGGNSNVCRLDAYLPDTDTCGKVFIYFHGGGIENGDKGVGYAESYTSRGVALVSANYRMYPNARFPEYIEDCAKCVKFVKEAYPEYNEIYIGGSSAGGYLSMMLAFDVRYLAVHGIDSLSDIAGYILDAGQPTTHFNILKYERGLSPNALRIDEAAPVYFIDKPYLGKTASALPKLQIFYAENDMPCRPEQTEMLIKTLEIFGYPKNKLDIRFMKGCSHCSYTGKEDYLRYTSEFILK